MDFTWLNEFIKTPFPLLGVLASIIGFFIIHTLSLINKKLDSIESKLDKTTDTVSQNAQRIAMIEGFLWSQLNESKMVK